ncbi:MAG: Uma2 family endonuclease [Fimbriimonadales bacterium]
MTSIAPAKPVSVEEFWRLCADGKPRELVRGEVREKMPVGIRHAVLASFVSHRLQQFLDSLEQRLGVVAVELGVVIRHADAESVRAPDIAFIRKERLPEPYPNAFLEIAPDLAIEIVSPNDAYTEVRDKVEELLQAGTAVVWVVDPQGRRVEVYQPNQPTQILREGDILSCEALLPGFRLPVAVLFGGLRLAIEGGRATEEA